MQPNDARPMSDGPDHLEPRCATAQDDLTYRIIGCATAVHLTLGAGFQEVIYSGRWLSRWSARALILSGRWNSRFSIKAPIFYQGIEIGSRRADFIVGKRLVIELKALTALEDVHLAQVKNYLTAYGFGLGLLLNFGGARLEYRRIFAGRR